MNVQPDDTSLAIGSTEPSRSPAEANLVAQIRRGNAEAGQEFVRQYYPGIYHYLLHLTGRPETAEDLTQETFVRAWRGLEGFEGRASLRVWLSDRKSVGEGKSGVVGCCGSSRGKRG